MAHKFVRNLVFTSGSSTGRMSYFLKMMYEFWGFCVYGGAAAGTPGFGAFAGSTTIAAGSNGVSLPTGTINVVTTAAAPTTGTIFVHTSTGTHAVAYTGKTATSFTGCTGGTGTMSTGNVVNSFAATNVPGNTIGCSTLIASGSNGVSLPTGTINVVSTATFPTSGTIYVYTNQGTQTIAYTGVTATSFTGCTGGGGTMSTGGNVTSNSLMTLGTDGYTNATTVFRQDGYTDFYATNIQFTSNMVGKQLVMWKPGSNSSEDGIYNIIAFKDQNNIVINVNNGGTPSGEVDGYRSMVTTRSSINYRVIDNAVAGAATGIADGSYMIFQVDPTGVNTGQAVAQLQLIVANSNQRIDYNMSPNGSWTGTAFGVDASGTRQPNNGQANTTQQQQNTTSAGTMTITLIGDKDFMIGYGKDSNHASSSGFHWHWEIPERLYTQAQDPNPFVVQLNGYSQNSASQFSSTGTTYGYGGGFVMRCSDGVYRNWRTTVKALVGDGDTDRLVGNNNLARPPGNTLSDFRAGANQWTGTLVNSSGFLTLPGVAGQYSLARARLKKVRFANSFMKTFTRFTANGDWMLITQGVAVPWDKTVMPLTIFPY
jgi:hypothetical protein